MDGYVEYSQNSEILKVLATERAWTTELIDHWQMISIGMSESECKKVIKDIAFLTEIKAENEVIHGFASEAMYRGYWISFYVGNTFETPLPEKMEKCQLIWTGKNASVWQIEDDRINWMYIFMKPVPASWYDEIKVSSLREQKVEC